MSKQQRDLMKIEITLPTGESLFGILKHNELDAIAAAIDAIRDTIESSLESEVADDGAD